MDKQLALTTLTHRAREVVCALDEIPQAVGVLEELPAARSNFDSKAHVTVEGMLNRLHLRLTQRKSPRGMCCVRRTMQRE
jgi:hypothetical protein